MNRIGERLAKLRKDNHYKQADIAEKLHISQQVVSNIERGITLPDVEQLKNFADIYSVSLDQLVGREFFTSDTDELERQIISYIKNMDDKGRELSLGLLSQVAQHRGNDDDKE